MAARQKWVVMEQFVTKADVETYVLSHGVRLERTATGNREVYICSNRKKFKCKYRVRKLFVCF